MSLETQGTKIQRGNGATPEVFTTIGEVKSWSGPDGAAKVIDTTHLLSTAHEKKIGIPDEGKVSLTVNMAATDVQQAGLRSDRLARTLRNFKILYSDGVNADILAAYVLKFAPKGDVDGIVEVAIDLEISGLVTRNY